VPHDFPESGHLLAGLAGARLGGRVGGSRCALPAEGAVGGGTRGGWAGDQAAQDGALEVQELLLHGLHAAVVEGVQLLPHFLHRLQQRAPELHELPERLSYIMQPGAKQSAVPNNAMSMGGHCQRSKRR
jgi:hypothetical protein